MHAMAGLPGGLSAPGDLSTSFAGFFPPSVLVSTTDEPFEAALRRLSRFSILSKLAHYSDLVRVN